MGWIAEHSEKLLWRPPPLISDISVFEIPQENHARMCFVLFLSNFDCIFSQGRFWMQRQLGALIHGGAGCFHLDKILGGPAVRDEHS
jgi:hypothetical protein